MVNDDPDITLTFKKGLEKENETSGNKVSFQAFTYNNSLLALAEFKVNFYDLLLIDVNMPKLNGFELSEKILELDLNVRICYISAGEMNIEALREQYKSLSLGCFITKPITVENLVRRRSQYLESVWTKYSPSEHMLLAIEKLVLTTYLYPYLIFVWLPST